jgi:hypothetical protein
VLQRLKPYWLHVYLLAFCPLMLLTDSRLTSLWQQVALGLLTFLLLWLCTRRLERDARRQVWLCVVVATGFEIFGSLIWGVYRYRWHNLPLFVPPGHGLVYLFGLTAAATPLVRRYGRRVGYVALAVCSAWSLAGLTLLPLVTHRFDLQGALCLPVYAFVILRSQRYALFAAIFLATTDLELVGTALNVWTWVPVAPWTHAPSGNPPSAIAGGYAIIDGSVMVVMAILLRLRILRPLPAPAPAPALAEAAA